MALRAKVGAQIAVDEVNMAGGYMGRPLQLVVRDDQANPELDRKYAEELGLAHPALLADSTGYGDAGLNDLEAALEKYKIKPSIVVRFPVGVQTLAAEIRQAQAAGSDLLIGGTVGPEFGVMAASRQRLGWEVPYIGPWGSSHRSALETSYGAVEGERIVQTVLPSIFIERNSSFLGGYQERRAEKPFRSMMAGAQAYDEMELLLRAMLQLREECS